ncbi:MAG: hypothetical protein ACOCV1_04350 [Bacillota bacterium]
MAILFYMLDMKSIELNTTYSVPILLEVRSVIKQIYKNIRTLLRNNPTVRATLNLETKDDGVYVTDVIMAQIDNMVEWCESNGYTTKKIYIIAEELNKLEMVIKDVLQYFSYFIRPDFKQKPDLESATETYKQMADERTLEELQEIVGRKNKLSFEGLGTQQIQIENASKDFDEDDYDEDDNNEEYTEEE